MLNFNKNNFWARWLPLLLGIAMFVGAWLVISKTSAAFSAVNLILGVIILLRGVTGMIRFYRNRASSRFKQKAQFGSAVFLAIVGILYLALPRLMGDAIKWRAALVFTAIAVRSLWALKDIRLNYPRFAKLILLMNIALITVCLVMVTIPLGTLFLLAMLIAAALILGGFDLIALSLLPLDTWNQA
ncbi:MAG: hypothetical protein GX858_07570 [Clostridiales bacterium]|nr:hypothetical protein [Clostridiales bacterium]